MRSWAWGPHDGLSVFTETDKNGAHSRTVWGRREKAAICTPKKSPHQEPDYDGSLTWDFPASRAVGSQRLSRKPPSLPCSAVAAGDTWGNLSVAWWTKPNWRALRWRFLNSSHFTTTFMISVHCNTIRYRSHEPLPGVHAFTFRRENAAPTPEMEAQSHRPQKKQ